MRVLITLCRLLLSNAAAQARDFSIDHLEPASWWVGMKHHRVEVMVHGEAIATLAPRLSRSGVALLDVRKVANPNYLFVTLDIAANAEPGSFDIEFLDGARVAARHPFRLDAR
jgi:hypothetical protein